jgi:hypothetical protein
MGGSFWKSHPAEWPCRHKFAMRNIGPHHKDFIKILKFMQHSFVHCNLSITTKVDLIHAPRHNADSGEDLMQNAAPGSAMLKVF